MATPLGSGAWSTVFREVRHGEARAVKYVRRDPRNRANDAHLCNMIGMEVDVLSRRLPRHPCVVALVHAVHHPTHSELVLELGDRDLFEVLQTQAWATSKPVFVDRTFAQLASAVEHLHRHRVVHRDLKLENALVDFDGRVKLIDFGLAHVFQCDADRMLRSQVGSLQYAAPEVFHKPCCYEAYAADVWSLGVVLFALVFERMPWEVAKASDAHFTAFLQGQDEVQAAVGFEGAVPLTGETTDVEVRLLGMLLRVLPMLLQVDPGKRPTSWTVTRLVRKTTVAWAPTRDVVTCGTPMAVA